LEQTNSMDTDIRNRKMDMNDRHRL
jgi:hypothetical protein